MLEGLVERILLLFVILLSDDSLLPLDLELEEFIFYGFEQGATARSRVRCCLALAHVGSPVEGGSLAGVFDMASATGLA